MAETRIPPCSGSSRGRAARVSSSDTALHPTLSTSQPALVNLARESPARAKPRRLPHLPGGGECGYPLNHETATTSEVFSAYTGISVRHWPQQSGWYGPLMNIRTINGGSMGKPFSQTHQIVATESSGNSSGYTCYSETGGSDAGDGYATEEERVKEERLTWYTGGVMGTVQRESFTVRSFHFSDDATKAAAKAAASDTVNPGLQYAPRLLLLLLLLSSCSSSPPAPPLLLLLLASCSSSPPAPPRLLLLLASCPCPHLPPPAASCRPSCRLAPRLVPPRATGTRRRTAVATAAMWRL
jgi:hypothetical protein